MLGAGFEGKGVEAAASLKQGDAGGPGEVPVFQQPGAGGAGPGLIGFFELPSHPLFFDEFEGGQEEVMKVAPDGMQPAQQGGEGGVVETPVIRCDEASWRFLGLSFAGWNAAISTALAAIAAYGAAKRR